MAGTGDNNSNGNSMITQDIDNDSFEDEDETPMRRHTNHSSSQSYLSQHSTESRSSVVTTESVLEDNALSTDEKKRKLQVLYYGSKYKEEDKYEIQKVRKIVRDNVFQQVKFCRGEGASKQGKSSNNVAMKRAFGKSHDAPDLTLRNGYAYEILILSGNGEDKKSLTERALWWKTYNTYVLHEVRQLRSSMNFNVKKSCIEGKMYYIEF